MSFRLFLSPLRCRSRSPRLCLNALQLEHAFGGRAVFVGVMLKHYKLAFLTQVGPALRYLTVVLIKRSKLMVDHTKSACAADAVP